MGVLELLQDVGEVSLADDVLVERYERAPDVQQKLEPIGIRKQLFLFSVYEREREKGRGREITESHSRSTSGNWNSL